MDKFRYVSHVQEVTFAPGSLAQLGKEVERLGWQRLILCASHSMQAQGHVDRLKSALGERLVGIFTEVRPHVQDVQVDEVLALATGQRAEAVIGLGGGSPIGMAKAVAYASGT